MLDFGFPELVSFKDGSDKRKLGVLDSSVVDPGAVGGWAPLSSKNLSGIEFIGGGGSLTLGLRP